MKRHTLLSAGLCLVLLVQVAAAQTQVYKPVPDVDKPGVPNDYTCWLACAANLLGGAGWGNLGDPQANADQIYNTLVQDICNNNGVSFAGYLEHATNYWLYAYGLNPDSPYYRPPVPAQQAHYTDVTVVAKAELDATDWNNMLAELARCQYVAASFVEPTPHCMTLVGGDYYTAQNTTPTGVWHDSDNDLFGTDDDYYTMSLGYPGFDMSEVNTGSPSLYHGWQYVTLCPGLQKPEEAVLNYDVAWFRQPTNWQDLNPQVPGLDSVDMTPAFDERGMQAPVFTDPTWGSTDPTTQQLNPNHTTEVVHIGNLLDLEQQKEVHLLIDYVDRIDRLTGSPNPHGIQLQYWDPIAEVMIVVAPDVEQMSLDNGQLMLSWYLPIQPEWEEILFPNSDYHTLWDPDNTAYVAVKDWNVATLCVPEPATLGLIAIGGLVVARRRAA